MHIAQIKQIYALRNTETAVRLYVYTLWSAFGSAPRTVHQVRVRATYYEKIRRRDARRLLHTSMSLGR